MVSFSSFYGLFSVLCLAATAHGCMSPSPTNPAACPAGPSSCTVFGIPEAKLARKTAAANAVHSLRGGGMHEPKTLDDVNALVLKAGSAGQLVVIDFTATWCGPCQMIAPVFKKLSQDHDDVVFLKVDVDQNPDTAAHYNIFIKGGVVVERVMGADPKKLQSVVIALA